MKNRLSLVNQIDQVVIYGDSTLTSPALHALLAARVEVCFLTAYGGYVGRLSPGFSKNGQLRMAQHRAQANPRQVEAVAAKFAAGKLRNQRTMLLRANRRRDEALLAQSAESLATIAGQIERLAWAPPPDAPPPAIHGHSHGNSPALDALLGLEGAGSAAYFGAFATLLPEDWTFDGRNRRPPRDPTNALLSYGYTLLMHQVLTAINIVGMDPYVGYLHSSQYGKPSLALDLMEEFRPLVVDSTVLTLLNNRMLEPGQFREELGTYRMEDNARRTFLVQFEERLDTTIRHPVFGYKASYRRCLELQARLLAKWLLGEIPAYRPFIVR